MNHRQSTHHSAFDKPVKCSGEYVEIKQEGQSAPIICKKFFEIDREICKIGTNF
jgi:hypothetical protein